MVSTVISASLSPNTEKDDVAKAFFVLLSPWTWRHGRAVERVERWFLDRFHAAIAVSFDSGRSAELAILHSFGIGQGDEVMVQAFTCVAVPNSVIWAGATSVYVDIDDMYNMDLNDMEKKRTKNVKAIIVQHTFGVPADMDRIVAFAHKYNLLIIEDCTHSLGATYHNKQVGTLGDAAFFSFGRDKVISSVWGGVAIINAKCQMPNAKSKLEQFHQTASMPSHRWIFQQLMHPVAFSLILPLYMSGIGKILLVLFQKLRMLSIPVTREEKRGAKPKQFPKRYPNGLAELLLVQLRKLDGYVTQRRSIAKYYTSALVPKGVKGELFEAGSGYLRFPVLVPSPDSLRLKAKKLGILLGNWYANVIDPTGVDMGAIGYIPGSCPRAERAARDIINLPTRISQAQAQKVMELF